MITNAPCRRTFCAVVLLLLLILLLALTTTDVVSAAGTNDFSDRADHAFISIVQSVTRFRIPVYPFVIRVALELSLLVSVLVFPGGRSKVKRFNDRTIELLSFLIYYRFSDGPSRVSRAVFYFISFGLCLAQPCKTYLSGGLPS